MNSLTSSATSSQIQTIPIEPTENTVAICEDCRNQADGQFFIGQVFPGQACFRCGSRQTTEFYSHDVLNPQVVFHSGVGDYVLSYSTEVALAPVVLLVLDVNCWYRDLGVRPGASREEIIQRFQEIILTRTARQTHCLKMLLDLDIKAKYDRMPLGKLYRDTYVEEMERWKSTREEVQRILEGEDFDTIQMEHAEEIQEIEREEEAERQRRADHFEDTWGSNEATFGYVLWHTRDDTAMARRWLHALIDAAHDAGVDPRPVTVGLHDANDSVLAVRTIHGRPAYLLSRQASHAMSQVAAMVVDTWGGMNTSPGN